MSIRNRWCRHMLLQIAVCTTLCTVVRVCCHSITLCRQLLPFVHGETTWRRLASLADNHHERTDKTHLLYTRLAPSPSFHLHHFLSHALCYTPSLCLSIAFRRLSKAVAGCLQNLYRNLSSSLSLAFPLLWPPKSKWKLWSVYHICRTVYWVFSFLASNYTHTHSNSKYTHPVN